MARNVRALTCTSHCAQKKTPSQSARRSFRQQKPTITFQRGTADCGSCELGGRHNESQAAYRLKYACVLPLQQGRGRHASHVACANLATPRCSLTTNV